MRRFANYAVFYGVWIAMVVGETYAWAILGFVCGYAMFLFGGILLAKYHHHFTQVDEKLFGWPLRFAQKVSHRWPLVGFVLNVMLNGAPGVSFVETARGSNWKQLRPRVYAASGLYATVWLLIHLFRPQLHVPVYWHPSLAALGQLWHLF